MERKGGGGGGGGGGARGVHDFMWEEEKTRQRKFSDPGKRSTTDLWKWSTNEPQERQNPLISVDPLKIAIPDWNISFRIINHLVTTKKRVFDLKDS